MSEHVSYDAIVVGAGPAGITTALELADAGLRVALVESGGFDFDPDVQALYDGEVTGLEEIDLTAIRLRMFGGTTNHWGGHCVPLDPIDFERAPLSSLSGWPFGRDHLLPFYARAHDYCRIGPFDYARDRARGVGDDDFLLPGDPRLETSPLIGSGPLNFGEAYRDAVAGSDRIDLRLGMNAVGFDLDADGRVGAVILRGLDGAEARLSGRAVVIACGAVETARLLMIANARAGQRYGDAGGLLGRCYMDHIAGGAAFLALSDPARPLAYWRPGVEDAGGREVNYVWRLADAVQAEMGLTNTHFYLIPFSDDAEERRLKSEARRSLGGLKSVVKYAIGRDRESVGLSEAYCQFITNADSFVAYEWATRVGGAGVSRVLLRYESEQLPTRDSFVALMDDTDALGLPRVRLNWSPGLAERESIVQSAVEIGRICGETGLGRIELEDHFDARYWDASTSWHQMGTARMAVAPRDGVVDADCRVHGTRNLFVAGGAVMPSVGRSNPTLTIVALSIRLADHLKAEVARL